MPLLPEIVPGFSVVPFRALNPLPKKPITCPYCGEDEIKDFDVLRTHLDSKHRGWQERAISELLQPRKERKHGKRKEADESNQAEAGSKD